jgi:hypothetical protein
MKLRRLRLVGALGLATAVVLSVGAGGAQSRTSVSVEGLSASAESAANVLAWNLIAVNTVRAASPAKAQVEGLIYMSYVQGSVYDAVTKIEGRYAPYHDFTTPVSPVGASPDAAWRRVRSGTLLSVGIARRRPIVHRPPYRRPKRCGVAIGTATAQA